MFSLIINILLWTVVSGVLGSSPGLDLDYKRDLIRGNDFLPSREDIIFSLWIGGCLAIFLWQRLSMLFFDTWDLLHMSPVQVWSTKNLSVWFYYLVAILFFPPLIWLPSVPLLWLIEKLEIHLGDYVLPLLTPLLRLFI